MANKDATARVKIDKLLEAAGWRFFAEGGAPANIRLEPGITIESADLDALGENFEKTSQYSRSQACRVVILSYSKRHCFQDSQRGSARFAKSVVIVLAPMANGHDVHRRPGFDLVQHDIAGPAKRHDQFAHERALPDLAIDERGAAQMTLDEGSEVVDRRLRCLEVLDGLGPIEQEVEQANQIVARAIGVANIEVARHPSAFLRRASSLR
jgi:hypothetical protein